MEDENVAWSQVEDESAVQNHACLDYLVNVPVWNRSVEAAHKYHKKVCDPNDEDSAKASTWRRWSKRFDWAAREVAYEAHQNAEHQKFVAGKRRKATEDHIQVAEYGMRLIAQKLRTTDPEDIPIQSVASWLEKITGLHRKALGIDTEQAKEIARGSGQGALQIHFHSANPQLKASAASEEYIDVQGEVMDDNPVPTGSILDNVVILDKREEQEEDEN